jgi:hypothetical protein
VNRMKFKIETIRVHIMKLKVRENIKRQGSNNSNSK